MDSRARGVFAGLDIAHGRGEVARSVMEGVAFALRQIRDAMGDRGLLTESLRASGNGLAAPLWRQIVADVLGIPLTAASVREPAGTGAAMIGGLAAGIYPDFGYLRHLTPEPQLVAEPKTAATTYYDDVYENWKNLYPRAGRLRGDAS
jgi:xylulokinase